MNFIQDTQPFEVLKQYFMPAIYHRISQGKSKFYQLSISMEGIEQIIKKSSKPFEHTGFNKVIMGAVMRMEKLFAPDHLNLEVILFKKPTLRNLEIAFELVNKSKFMIGNEPYIASIMVEYSYSKMNTVTYYPIIYRQVCSNGMVAVMTQNFTEKIPVDKIFEIGCDWSRCTFETYQRKLKDYFEILKYPNSPIGDVHENDIEFKQKIIRKMERVLKTSIQNNREEMIFSDRPSSQNASSIISENVERLGNNDFAVWNSITDFASRERDVNLRNQMFLNAGRFLSNEVEKTLNKNKTVWAENLVWDDVVRIAK
jgi:flagellar biosynthesis/type III secretory pathway chaperone